MLITFWASHVITESNHVGQAWFAFVNPYWLFPMTFLSFRCLKMAFSLHQKPSSTWSYTDWPTIPWILLLILLEDGWDVCQPWGTLPDSHKLLKMIESSLWCQLAPSATLYVSIWFDSINLHISNLFKWSVTSSSTSVGNASLPQTLPLRSGIWKESLSVKEEEKKLLNSPSFSVTF